ncbi:Lysoplasmalogenase-like protein tmem86a [Branchiostoma belcheri]|nr:Lysoplasmalogenase-like protein tmem86a [Branchiostoma belcheri]
MCLPLHKLHLPLFVLHQLLTLLKLLPFFITFILYFALLLPDNPPSAEATVVKMLPAMGLVLFLGLHGKVFCGGRLYDRLLFAATFLCGVADGVIAWDHHHDAFFLAGMGVFGAAHCVFMAAFRCTPLRLILWLPWLTVALILYGVLTPGLYGAMFFFVLVYALVIGGMGWRSFSRVEIRCCVGSCTGERCAKWCVLSRDDIADIPEGQCWEASGVTWTQVLAAAGAVLFAISDSILSVFAFRVPGDPYPTARRVAVLSTYWVAILFLALSVEPAGPCPCQGQAETVTSAEDEDVSTERIRLSEMA